MPRLKWARQAAADVQRLYQFLLPKNADAARRAATAIRGGVRILAHQPHLGRAVEDLDPEFREWLIDFGDSGYVVRYHVAADEVTILAIRHQKEAGFR